MAPTDDYAFVGLPPFVIPEHEEVQISCTFTWDTEEAEVLAENWRSRTDKKVIVGGVAYNSPCEDFIPGMYVKEGVVFTSRGCNNNCKWCFVPSREGKVKELPICKGNIIQDNNFLQCSREHKDKVFDMLRTQRGICFKGGLESDLIDDHFINNITSLRIRELWVACDTNAQLPRLKKALDKLKKAGFNRNKIMCYSMSYGEDIGADEYRNQEIFNSGALPFTQLYQSEKRIEYPKEVRQWARMWSRPALMKAHMKEVNNGTRNNICE